MYFLLFYLHFTTLQLYYCYATHCYLRHITSKTFLKVSFSIYTYMLTPIMHTTLLIVVNTKSHVKQLHTVTKSYVLFAVIL